MRFSAKDATILAVITSEPRTRVYDRLVEKLQAPEAREVARRLRERATQGPQVQGPTLNQR